MIRGSDPSKEKKFTCSQNVKTGFETHLSYPMGSRGSFMAVKRPGREAHRSPQSSAEVMNEWSYTSILCFRDS